MAKGWRATIAIIIFYSAVWLLWPMGIYYVLLYAFFISKPTQEQFSYSCEETKIVNLRYCRGFLRFAIIMMVVLTIHCKTMERYNAVGRIYCLHRWFALQRRKYWMAGRVVEHWQHVGISSKTQHYLNTKHMYKNIT